ncbi:MAG: metal-dependent hydrolase [Flavobacteriaceae bacterium]
MDSLTQIVLGAAVGEAVLGKKIGNKAMFYGAIAGTIPDLDVLSSHFVDTVTALEIHRGFTHSIVFSVLMGLGLGWLVSKYDTNATQKEWSCLFFMALVTHPLLDAHTSWGTQLFWPLDLRLAYKNIFVIDPLYTVPFLVFLIWAMFLPKASHKRRKLNKLGLLISSCYMLITIGLKGISYQHFKTALAEQQINYLEIETKPSPLNTILWTANIELNDSYLIGDYSFFDTKPIDFKTYPKNHHLVTHLKTNTKLERLIHISKGWYTITEVGGQLYFNDLRFGLIGVNEADDQFVFSYLLSEEENGLTVSEVPKEMTDGKQLLFKLWKRIKGN